MTNVATTRDEVDTLVDKLPLSSASKMVLKKDLLYGWSWSATNPDLLKSKKTVSLYTVITPDGTSLHVTKDAMKEMVQNARRRHRSVQQRIEYFNDTTTSQATKDLLSKATGTARRYHVERDHEVGLQSSFSSTGWGAVDVITGSHIPPQCDTPRKRVDGTKPLGDQEKATEPTQVRNMVRAQRTTPHGNASISIREAQSGGAKVSPRQGGMVRMADRRDGQNSLRTAIQTRAVDLEGDL